MGKIITHSHGIAKHRDDKELNRLAFESAKREKTLQAVAESNVRIEAIDKRSADQAFLERSANNMVLERAALNSGTSLLHEGKVTLFKEVLLEAFVKSLVIDEYVVTENADRFDGLVADYIHRNGGYALLENAVKEHKIPMLKNIKELCDSVALEASRRIGKEIRENKDLAEKPIFTLNEEEKDKFDAGRAELNVEKLSELVKDKVLTVVKDERDRQSKEKELLDDLKAKAAETGEEVEKKPVMGTATLKESTLFNSIMHNTFNEHLKAVHESHTTYGGDDDDSLVQNEFNLGSSGLTSPLNTDVELETIMCESIIYYTLMELTNTICLETFTREDIMNMSHKMLNPRR